MKNRKEHAINFSIAESIREDTCLRGFQNFLLLSKRLIILLNIGLIKVIKCNLTLIVGD